MVEMVNGSNKWLKTMKWLKFAAMVEINLNG